MIDYSTSALSLIPPIVALGMTILTRRVLLSLGLGVIIGSLLLADYSVSATLSYLFDLVAGLFYSVDAQTKEISLNMWNLSVIIFLFQLGILTALLTLSGGTRAFALWAQSRIKSKRGAKLLAVFIGLFIFVDDYFNSLAVGAIARPITDKFEISRAKLAYVLDSTAAPICILMPISSWGAYIITLIGSILAAHGVTEYTQLGAFLEMVPMNFYAVFALLMVLCVAWFQIDIGPMQKHEFAAAHHNDTSSAKESSNNNSDDFDIVESLDGKIVDLMMPILVLIFATMGAMLFTGYQNTTGEISIFALLENTDIGMSLDIGGMLGLIAAIIAPLRQKIAFDRIMHAIVVGFKSMSGAALILLFAWSISTVISDVNTGSFISQQLLHAKFNTDFLPLLLFLTAFVMAFATGTSWGTFGVMLPIAADMAQATDITMMLPTLAAVLAGSVCGDHCSPISDTTILSSTGARCNHIDHVTTQLPYALLVAAISSFGYLIMGLTRSAVFGFVGCTFAFVIVVSIMHYFSQKNNAKMELKLKES